MVKEQVYFFIISIHIISFLYFFVKNVHTDLLLRLLTSFQSSKQCFTRAQKQPLLLMSEFKNFVTSKFISLTVHSLPTISVAEQSIYNV